MKAKLLVILLILSIVTIGCTSTQAKEPKGIKATVFKSPTCGCCVGYAAELRKNGFDVEVVETTDMAGVHQKQGIPSTMDSCHTTIIGDYFIEGHVPIDAVDKLLEEKPAIDGISLPNMPAGSPGMPGRKRGVFTIYALTDGAISEFTKI